jgi:hypothetical protein
MLNKEELEEHIDILAATGDALTVGSEEGVREADFVGMVEEDHIGVLRPVVWVAWTRRNYNGLKTAQARNGDQL